MHGSILFVAASLLIATVPALGAERAEPVAWPSSPFADTLLAADPLTVPALVEDAMAPLATATPSQVHRHLAGLAGRTIDDRPIEQVAPVFLDEVPSALQPAVLTLWSGKLAAEAHLHEAFALFTDEELATIEARLAAAEDARGDVAMGTASAQQVADVQAFLSLTERIDQDALATAGFVWVRAVEQALAALEGVAPGEPEPDIVGSCASGSVVFESASCLVVIGGSGATHYHSTAAITIDLGGADLYENNAGGSTLLVHAAAAAIDLGPSADVYDVFTGGGDAAQGGGYRGLGVLVDEGGSDTYEARFSGTSASARTWTQGTGVLGLGLLWDRGTGNDDYRARNIAQGAGLQGFGYLIDEGGADRYTIPYTFDSEGGQGTGCYHNVGALVDRGAERDIYDAYIDDMQGFGCLAAIGIQYDGGGSDDYILRAGLGELSGNTVVQSGWGQAYGELGAVGILYDTGGSDSYLVTGTSENSGQQTQGVGIIGGVGVLVDASGHDTYTARATVQGADSLGALGVLADHGGNDRYTGLVNCQGWGLAAIGVLSDTGGGADTYACPDPVTIGSRGDDRFWSGGLAGGLGSDR